MKRHAFWIFLSLLGLVWLILSCDSVDENCRHKATVVDLGDGCGYGFELENGKKLQHVWDVLYCGTPPLPKEVTEHPLYNFQFVEGKRVLIGFEKTDAVIGCNLSRSVKITCLQEMQIIEY
jgi:hypothetical protein